MPDDHYEIAYEQYLWWRRQGLTHSEMLEAVGVDPPASPTALEVVCRLAMAHQALACRMALGEAA